MLKTKIIKIFDLIIKNLEQKLQINMFYRNDIFKEGYIQCLKDNGLNGYSKANTINIQEFSQRLAIESTLSIEEAYNISKEIQMFHGSFDKANEIYNKSGLYGLRSYILSIKEI